MRNGEMLDLFMRLRRWHRMEGAAPLRLLSPSEFETLGTVRFFAQGRVGMTELASFLGVSLPAVSRMVGRLERRGFVAREAGADRRNVTVVLTEKGNSLFDEAKAELESFFRRALSHLTAEEQAEYFRLGGKITEGIREELEKLNREALC